MAKMNTYSILEITKIIFITFNYFIKLCRSFVNACVYNFPPE
jgi:hypothetical protein